MTALAKDRYIQEAIGAEYSASVKAAAKIFAGALIAQDTDGDAAPGFVSTAIRTLGIAMEYKDNTLGGDGALTVRYRKGVFMMENSASADEITDADVDNVCYIVDDQTVARTSGTNTRSIAGKIRGIDTVSLKVYVEVGYVTNVDGDLVAANNLSECTPATARSNIGANLVEKYLGRYLMNASATYYVPCEIAGVITSIRSAMEGALTGGDPTITCLIDATPITTGVLTLAAAGSGANVKDSCAPSAARTVAAGNSIGLTVAANSQSNAVYASITARIET